MSKLSQAMMILAALACAAGPCARAQESPAQEASANAGAIQEKYFSHWPAGRSPREIGKRVAEHFVTAAHQDPRRIVYPEVCNWYGALAFAQVTGDKDLAARVIQRFDPLFTTEAGLLPPVHLHPAETRGGAAVDFSVFGTVPLQIYMQTKDPKYREMGLKYADGQWQNPRPDGLTTETRFWVDDMYMITILQTQAFRATGDKKYLDRAAKEMVAYLDKLQQPNGLFFHAPDVPFFWGRGNGWFAAGMAELLRDLPASDPRRARIMDGYQKMMKGLLAYQGADGMWRELLDRADAWPETSGSGMFTFAMITGVKNGWLDAATYGPAARKAWIALSGYVDQNATVTSICVGTGKCDAARDGDCLAYYMMRPRHTGDMHGQAPVLWSATALLR